MMTFDAAAFGPITLDHLPPFAQRLREAANLVWEDTGSRSCELGNGRSIASASHSICCRTTVT